MVQKPRFTKNRLIKILDTPKTGSEIQTAMGCSYRTTWNMLKSMLSKGEIIRKNRGSKIKPFYEYHLTSNIKPEEKETSKKTLKSLGREL